MLATKQISQQLSDSLQEKLIAPNNPSYDEARSVWNGMIDKKPGVIVRCRGVADIKEAVRFARKNELRVAVRGGGHNIAGHAVCDRGIVIDLSQMRSVRVEPQAKKARVGPGAVWADVDRETQAFGLAVPGGLVSSTGVAGLTLGGGFGWLSRRFGLTSDNLLSADLITADGHLLKASERENPDLFWAIRGGGGNFGIVTSFEFQLNEVGPEVLSGLLLYRLEDAPEVIRHYREVMAEAPDELSCYLLFRPAPPAPFLPERIHGRPILALVMCYAGDLEAGEAATQALRAFGEPLADKVMPRPYTEFQQISDANWQPGFRDYWKAEYLKGLSDGAIDTLVQFARHIPTPMTDFKIAHFEGAVSRIPTEATAFPHRNAPFVININTRWKDAALDDENIEWTRALFEAVQPYSTGGTYVSFLGEEGQERVKAAFGNNYERLVAVKNEYDPENFFHLNQNIKPTV